MSSHRENNPSSTHFTPALALTSAFCKWMFSLSGPEWKVICYLALHTHCSGQPDARLSFDELMSGRIRPIDKAENRGLCSITKDGFMNKRVDMGCGLNDRHLECALGSLVRDGLVSAQRFLVDNTNYFCLEWKRLNFEED